MIALRGDGRAKRRECTDGVILSATSCCLAETIMESVVPQGGSSVMVKERLLLVGDV